ncbi:MAG: fibrillarin-like rRNA/tRNA 2'-O-methyltransferase [Candidatus Micrarchaeia archaeon]
MTVEKLFDGVFRVNGRLATKNLVEGKGVYGERRVVEKGVEYRLWEPSRSKLGAAVVKGLKVMPVAPGVKVLYLGASTGTTVSHVSDVLGRKGVVFAVEFSPVSMKNLISLCQVRENIFPLLADARMPQEYEADVDGKVDVVFEDVADSQQAEILVRNAEMFLKKGGFALVAVKAFCIDSSQEPSEVFARVRRELSQSFELIQRIDLNPFEKGHEFLVLKYK